MIETFSFKLFRLFRETEPTEAQLDLEIEAWRIFCSHKKPMNTSTCMTGAYFGHNTLCLEWVTLYPSDAILMRGQAFCFPPSDFLTLAAFFSDCTGERSDFVAADDWQRLPGVASKKGTQSFELEIFPGEKLVFRSSLKRVFEAMPHKWQSCLPCHTQTNQQFLKTVTEQGTEMQELHSQLR